MSSARKNKRRQQPNDAAEGDARLLSSPTRSRRGPRTLDFVGGEALAEDGTARRMTRRSSRNSATSALAELPEGTSPTVRREAQPRSGREGPQEAEQAGSSIEHHQILNRRQRGNEVEESPSLHSAIEEGTMEEGLSLFEDVFSMPGVLPELPVLALGAPGPEDQLQEAGPEVANDQHRDEVHISRGGIPEDVLDAVNVQDEEELLQLVEGLIPPPQSCSDWGSYSLHPPLNVVSQTGTARHEGHGGAPVPTITISDDDGDEDLVVLNESSVQPQVNARGFFLAAPGQPSPAGPGSTPESLLTVGTPSAAARRSSGTSAVGVGASGSGRAPAANEDDDDDVQVVFESRASTKRRRPARALRPQVEGASTQIFIILDSPEATQAVEQRQQFQHSLSRGPSLQALQHQHQQHTHSFLESPYNQNVDLGLRLGTSGLDFDRAGGAQEGVQNSVSFRSPLSTFGGPAAFNSQVINPGIPPSAFHDARRGFGGGVANSPAASDDKSSPVEAGPPQMKCPICLDTMTEHTTTVCGHLFCKACISLAVQTKKCCPTCRRKLGKSSFHRVYIGT